MCEYYFTSTPPQISAISPKKEAWILDYALLLSNELNGYL